MKGLSLKIQRQRGTAPAMNVADRFRDGTPYEPRSVDPPATLRVLTLQEGWLAEEAVTTGIETVAAIERAHAAYLKRQQERPFDQETD